MTVPRKSKRSAGRRSPAARPAEDASLGDAAKPGAAADSCAAVLLRIRALMRAADPEIVEDRRWGDVPVWSRGGIICTGETYRDKVKMTFAKGASLADPDRLFNSSLDGRVRRAIDIFEPETMNDAALIRLVRAAVALNLEKKAPAAKKAGPRGKAPAAEGAPVRLLAGGNPQIKKGEGASVVDEYIRAMPGWKRAVGEQIDRLIVSVCPTVRKAVKWNSPLYGRDDVGFFLGIHCLTRSVKIAFFRGSSLRPPPPGSSKSPDTRYLDVREDDAIDENLFSSWIRQAITLPGVKL